jgi:tRNA G10  N-methylase Trm11
MKYNLLAMNPHFTQLGFVLGRDYTLSVSEIFAVFARKGIPTKSFYYDKDILIVEIDNGVSSPISINELGGTIKMFEILGKYNDISDIKTKLLEITPFESEKRINFGISGYGKLNKKVVLNLGYEIKEAIMDAGYKSRFVTGKNIDLTSVIVHENKLIERGFEAILLKTGQTYILGRTLAVQDYKMYSKRDYGRPKRDDHNGMLPPKLAQIMINLAKAPNDSVIYDPFCGSGTVLQEAILLGYKEVYGSDITEKNVEDSKANLEWLRVSSLSRVEKFSINSNNIFRSDVLSPLRKISADTIVGEGYLGEPHRRTKEQAIRDTVKLADFYLKALKNLVNQLKPNRRIVLAIPFFVVGSEYFYLPILDKLSDIGLDIKKPELGDTGLGLYGRGNLTYSRSDQFVGREILILQKS